MDEPNILTVPLRVKTTRAPGEEMDEAIHLVDDLSEQLQCLDDEVSISEYKIRNVRRNKINKGKVLIEDFVEFDLDCTVEDPNETQLGLLHKLQTTVDNFPDLAIRYKITRLGETAVDRIQSRFGNRHVEADHPRGY